MSASLSACDKTPQSQKTVLKFQESGKLFGALVAPEDFDAAYQGDYFQLPSRWNMQTHPEINGSYEVASFRVKLNFPAYDPDLSFHMISPHSAWQIYVDGQLIHRNGAPSTEPKTAKAHWYCTWPIFLSLYYVVTMDILLTIGLFHLIIYIADRKHRKTALYTCGFSSFAWWLSTEFLEQFHTFTSTSQTRSIGQIYGYPILACLFPPPYIYCF